MPIIPPQIRIQYRQIYQLCPHRLGLGTGGVGESGAGKEGVMHCPLFSVIRQPLQHFRFSL